MNALCLLTFSLFVLSVAFFVLSVIFCIEKIDLNHIDCIFLNTYVVHVGKTTVQVIHVAIQIWYVRMEMQGKIS